MDLHDLSMKHHSEMMNIAGEIRKYKDNTTLPPALQYVINPLIKQVEKADEDMMAWMNQIQKPSDLKTKKKEEIDAYLTDELSKIKAIDKDILTAGNAAQELFNQIKKATN